jgi:membrane protein
MEQDRGHDAEAPWQIPARGWTDILRHAWKNAEKQNLSLVAGGVTYYLLVAMFPTLVALVSLYCLVANQTDVTRNVQSLSDMFPSSTVRVIGDELRQLVSASSKNLGLGVIISIAIALWSGVRGMRGIMTALNIAYDRTEARSFIRFNATALLLTVVAIAGGLIALVLVAGLPLVLSEGSLHGPGSWIGLVVEWPVLIMCAMGMMALIYRYGPDRSKPEWKWASPGVIVATILWVAGSILFATYVYHFGSYNRTYGSLGGLLVLLTWMWLSAFVVLFGAEINGEAERQTRQDTTAGTVAGKIQSRR